MNFWGKFFTFIVGIILIGMALGMIAITFNLVPLLTLQEWVVATYLFFSQNIFSQALGVIFTVILVLVALLIFRLLIPKREKSLIYHTEQGDIRVSFDSLQSLAQEALRGFDEILQSRAEVEKVGNEARLILHLIVKPEASIPELSPIIQNRVKEKIERQTGVIVKEVKLTIDLKSEDKEEKEEEETV
ncbi:MAG TPA: alkaline shock response membrane anchor protein AmaP [Candidatus Atribacteria bacterium]|nr:alkaline shock response membrane anchor protein AmaP [Candidatus Atribacteria bacterium]